jgi:hypothetical protein
MAVYRDQGICRDAICCARREEVLTLYLIMMAPNMRTGGAAAGWVSVILNLAA